MSSITSSPSSRDGPKSVCTSLPPPFIADGLAKIASQVGRGKDLVGRDERLSFAMIRKALICWGDLKKILSRSLRTGPGTHAKCDQSATVPSYIPLFGRSRGKSIATGYVESHHKRP